MSRLNLRQVKIMQEALDGAGECRSYSGRGMYGKTCISVQGSYQQCGEVVAGAIQFMTQELADKICDEHDARNSQTDDDGSENLAVKYQDDMDAIVLELVAHAKTDSMGREVVMYWENIPPLADHEDDDCEEEDEK